MNYKWMGVICLATLGSSLMGIGLQSNNTEAADISSQISPPNTNSLSAQADQLLLQGNKQFSQRQFQEALGSYQQALELYRSFNHRQGEARALNNLGLVSNSLAQYQKAIAYFQQGLVVFRQLRDRKGEIFSLTGLGTAHNFLGQFREAIDYFQQTLALSKQSGDANNEVNSLSNLGGAYYALGEYRQAITYFQQTLAFAKQNRYPKGEASSLNNLGLAYNFLGEPQKAIDYFQQSLTLARQVGDRNDEVGTLNNLGLGYSSLGQYQQAVDYYQQALVIVQQIHNRYLEGITLDNLGNGYQGLGQYQKAISYHQQALTIAEQIGNANAKATIINNLGFIAYALGEYQKALEYHQQVLNIKEQIGDRSGIGVTLNGLGTLYYTLGQYQKAIVYYQKALALRQQIGERRGVASSFTGLGNTYYALGEFQKAIEYYQQSLAISKQIGDKQGEALSIGNLGNTYYALGEAPKAIEYYQQALAIAKQIGDVKSEGTYFNNIGAYYSFLGQYQKALDYFQQGLVVTRQIGDRAVEGKILGNIGQVLAQTKQPELAIAFYKQSVKVREKIRQDLRSLDKVLQQSYTQTVAETYRSLAELLLKQNRIIEALQVLDLLKVQELDDFFKNIKDEQKTDLTIQLLPVEQQFLSKHTAFADLEFKRDANAANFLQQLKQISSQELNTLPPNLRHIPKDAVLLYPVIFNEHLELVLFAPNQSPLRYSVNIEKSVLESAIRDFRRDISYQPRSIEDINDTKKNGQKLYQLLIQPLEADLVRINPKTIIYAPDGKLRYIPLSALFDGKQWLVEKYRVNNIVSYNLTDFDPKLLNQARVLAGAFGGNAEEKQFGFRGLPGSLIEVEGIALTMPDTIKLLGQDFSLKAMETKLSDRNIVHFATHAQFVSGIPDDSYVLLGSGDKVTLHQVKNWNMSKVDLVVLSACQTGLGGLKDGLEVLGLGYQFQVAGAKATIASLWEVSDSSTQKLMNTFYSALNQGMTKAEALRYAQITLISQKSEESKLNFSSPYYWSPFILIGNGQ